MQDPRTSQHPHTDYSPHTQPWSVQRANGAAGVNRSSLVVGWELEVVPVGADVKNSCLVTDADWGMWTLRRNRVTSLPSGIYI